MSWADIIIILAASVLVTVLRHLDKQITYNCPPYCAIDHVHFCPKGKKVFLDCQSDCYEDCAKRH